MILKAGNINFSSKVQAKENNLVFIAFSGNFEMSLTDMLYMHINNQLDITVRLDAIFMYKSC